MRREINVSDAVNMPGTMERVRKIVHRAMAKGLSGGYRVYTEDRSVGDTVQTVLVIEGEPARYYGWTFVALVEPENGSLVVSRSPFYEGPEFDRSTFVENHCAHCQRRVARRKYLILENVEGQRIQIGTSCAKDFLGHPLNVKFFDDFLADLEAYYGRGITGFSVLAALALAARVTSSAGYVKSGDAGCTRDIVMDMLAGGRAADEAFKEFGYPTEANREEAASALAWAAEMPGHGEYAENVRAVVAAPTASLKRLGLVVSIIPSYRRSIADAKIKADRPSAPAPVGRTEVEGVVISVKWVENEFGGSLKMLVEAEPGFRVWATVPKDLLMIPVVKENGRWEEWREVNVGERVAFVVTLEQSKDDSSFAFGKRPSKARVLSA